MENSVRVSTPEIVAMTLLSVLMLIAGVLVAAEFGDFAMRGQPGSTTAFSSRAMPAGMVMSGQQSTEQMIITRELAYFAQDSGRRLRL